MGIFNLNPKPYVAPATPLWTWTETTTKVVVDKPVGWLTLRARRTNQMRTWMG